MYENRSLMVFVRCVTTLIVSLMMTFRPLSLSTIRSLMT